MHDFIMGKVKEEKPQQEGTIQDLFTEQEAQTPDGNSFTPTEPLKFSQEAQAVLDAEEIYGVTITNKQEPTLMLLTMI